MATNTVYGVVTSKDIEGKVSFSYQQPQTADDAIALWGEDGLLERAVAMESQRKGNEARTKATEQIRRRQTKALKLIKLGKVIEAQAVLNGEDDENE